MMTRRMKRSTRRSGTFLVAASLLLAVAVGLTTTMRASDNIDFDIGGRIYDTVWDSRLFDGTAGFPGAVLWFHNPAGMPSNFTHASFEAAIETSFNTWESVDDGVPEEPLVPVVNLGGQTTVTDARALDGVNAITWKADFPGGTLAITPCWALDLPTTTTTNAQGQTVMPVDGGSSIPFPGPPGVTYPVGTVIDCGMQFDTLDPWSTTAVPDAGAFDVQGIATHEGGHFIGVSHSTLGDFEAANPMSATMLPVVAPGDVNPRTLEQDDKSSVLRVYARNRFSGPIPQTAGGRAVINLRLLKDGACVPATGLSVVAYRTQSGIDGMSRVEAFSGSQLRAFTPHQPFNGSVTLNVPPLPAGESYTIYARTLETGQGELAANRYNYTTINSNLLDSQGHSRTFDQLATISSLAAGQTRNLGDVGILGCTVADPNSQTNLVADSITAPASAYKGGQFTVTSTFRNQGTVAAGAFQVGVYVSTDQTINASDTFTGFACTVSGLASGAVAACDGSVPVPSAIIPGNYYVGVLVDRQNQVIENTESDNGLAAASPTAIAPNPLDPIVNGSFETGTLAGWSVKELTPASNPNLLLSVHPAGVEYPAPTFFAFPYLLFLDYFTSAPTDGLYAALHDFNGNDPATSGPVNRRELYQDVTLPATTTTLQFDYRAAWELFRFNSTLPRTFSVEIEPGGGGPPLKTKTILTAPDDTYEEDTDHPSGGVGFYPAGLVDLSAYRSQTVRLKFVWNIPEPGTGFGFFQLDNIRLNTSSVPNVSPVVTITSPANGASSTLGRSVTFTATASDQEDGNIAGSILWASNRDGVIGAGGTVSTSALTVGAHTITASVLDSGGLPASASIAFTVNPSGNTAPSVAITSPANGSSSIVGQSVTFSATATDTQDGTISGNISWTSDRDGPIGAGGNVSTSALTVGTHLITASVTDSGGLSGSASIIFTVNPPANTAPTAGNQAVSTSEDAPLQVTLSGADAEQCELQFAVLSAPTKGTLGAIISNGCTGGSPNSDTAVLTYTPGPNFNGSDSFTYRVSDGLLTADAAVSITVNPINDAPIASNRSVTTVVGTAVTVVMGATDVDGCDLAFSVVQVPSSGSLGAIENDSCVPGSPNSDSARITYTPAGSGIHTFTYKANDGVTDSNTATVTVTVDAPPPPATMHVGDLDGSSINVGKGNWTATVTAGVHDSNHSAVVGATDTGFWSGGASGSASCTTALNGRCDITSAAVANAKKNVTFTITSVTNGVSYNAADNHDADGDSNGGTAITVRKP
jgi:hypothetical protein